MGEREQVLRVLVHEAGGLRDRFGVKRLGLFGSVARNEAGEDYPGDKNDDENDCPGDQPLDRDGTAFHSSFHDSPGCDGLFDWRLRT